MRGEAARNFNRLVPTPFFGIRLRRQNFNLAPTQYRQLHRLEKPQVAQAHYESPEQHYPT